MASEPLSDPAATVSSGTLPDPRDTKLSVAPMLDRTDRHFRYLARLLAPDVRLYTEMLVAQAVVNNARADLLRFHPAEMPVALQLGGSEPVLLADAARIGSRWGYAEINLNVGCPSDRVQSGQFGACLMGQPELVAGCVSAMRRAVDIPVSVKTRIGIDDQDDFAFLRGFVATVAQAGCDMFVVHARKAILAGLSPKENRTIPPLRYESVYRLKQEFPELRVVINGGIRSSAEVLEHLRHVDGVMIGREAYRNPYWLAELQATVLGGPGSSADLPARADVVRQLAEYAEAELHSGARLAHITRHALGLYSGLPGARHWRRFLTEAARVPGAGPEVLLRSLDYLD